MGLQTCAIELDQARVHYDTDGPETGPSVLLLHGASFTSQTWQQLGTMELLAGAGYRVCAVDLPGFGASEPNPGLSSRWLRRFVQVLSLPAPVIVSPSMSGRFVLPMAIENPELIAGLVAIAPVGIPKHLASLAQVACPVLVVWGQNDQLIPIEQAEQLAATVQRGQTAILRGAGHAAYMDKPAEFHALLLTFLQQEFPVG